MSWGDYGALEGVSLRGYGLGEPSPQPGVFTGPFRALTPSSALTEHGEGVGDVRTAAPTRWIPWRCNPPCSVSALSDAGVSPRQQEPVTGSPAVPSVPADGGTTANDPAPASLSASGRAYTLPPKAGMVPPVPRATGRAQLMSGRSNTLYEAMLEVHEAWFNLLTEMCAAWRWQAGKHAFAAKRDKATEDLRAFRAEVPK